MSQYSTYLRSTLGPEHEVVDEELRAPSEEVCSEALLSSVSKSKLLVD
jgi:hypothetical protein